MKKSTYRRCSQTVSTVKKSAAIMRSTSSRISPPIRGRPTRPAYVQRLATSRRCQRSSVAGWTTNERQPDRGSSRLAAARNTRSADFRSARPLCRRSTASSWRSSTISSSLNSSERKRNAAAAEGVRARRSRTTRTTQLLQDAERANDSPSQTRARRPEPS